MLQSLLAGIVFLLTTLTSLTNAQGYEYNQSTSFHLSLVSQDSKYNGKSLFACHEGAAIEALCFADAPVDPTRYAPFRLNYTAANPGWPSGPLVYNFSFTGPDRELVSIWVGYQPSFDLITNIAVGLFQPSDQYSVPFSFDAQDRLGVRYSSARPGSGAPAPVEGQQPYESFSRNWYMCDTYYGYRYNTLAWAVGMDPKAEDLDNKSCVKVDVVRVNQTGDATALPP